MAHLMITLLRAPHVTKTGFSKKNLNSPNQSFLLYKVYNYYNNHFIIALWCNHRSINLIFYGVIEANLAAGGLLIF